MTPATSDPREDLVATVALARGGDCHLHLTGDARDAGACPRRADHAILPASVAVAEMRLAIVLDPAFAALVRQLLQRLGCDHDLGRISDAALGELVSDLLATGRILAIECAPRPCAPVDLLPAMTVPIHIGRDGTDFADCPRHRAHVQITIVGATAAQQLVQRCIDGGQLPTILRALGGDADPANRLPIAELAAAFLRIGRLCAVQCPVPRGPTGRKAPPPPPKKAPAPVAKEQRKQELAKTWIEFHIVRSRDQKPVSGARYRLELADGTMRTGTTDAEGIVYEKGIEPGECKITLLDYERDEWRRQ